MLSVDESLLFVGAKDQRLHAFVTQVSLKWESVDTGGDVSTLCDENAMHR